MKFSIHLFVIIFSIGLVLACNSSDNKKENKTQRTEFKNKNGIKIINDGSAPVNTKILMDHHIKKVESLVQLTDEQRAKIQQIVDEIGYKEFKRKAEMVETRKMIVKRFKEEVLTKEQLEKLSESRDKKTK